MHRFCELGKQAGWAGRLVGWLAGRAGRKAGRHAGLAGCRRLTGVGRLNDGQPTHHGD